MERESSDDVDVVDARVGGQVEHRFDDPLAPNVGTGPVRFGDIGAIEGDQVPTSDVDLVTTSVVGPTTGTPGQVVTVSWTVQDRGQGTAIGPWSDAVYLSPEPVYVPAATFLA